MTNKGAILKVGDKVISKEGDRAGTISRLCSDLAIVCIKWDDSPTQQEMVEVAGLKAPVGGKG